MSSKCVPLNILVSSSRQWNPGDEFIYHGVRRLLSGLLHDPINWLLWNRNPDLFVKRWEDPRIRTDFLTNSMQDPCLDLVDLVVLAGTPEWTGAPVERVYRELLRFPNIPLLAVGVGSGGADLELSALEREVLSRENTLLTVRNRELADCIDAQLGVPKAHVLPCPAIFSADEAIPPPREPLDKVAVILQSSGVVNQSISEDLVQSILQAVCASSGDFDFDIVCFYPDEFLRFSRMGFRSKCVYSFDSADYYSILKRYRAVLSTRLHGAIAALSVGVPAAILAKDNFRIQSTQKLFEAVLPSLSPVEAVAWSSSMVREDLKARVQDIAAFREELKGAYSELITEFLKTHLCSGQDEHANGG